MASKSALRKVRGLVQGEVRPRKKRQPRLALETL
jgi:hypothetical protein